MVVRLLVLSIILYVYSPWFEFAKTLSSGDFPYLFLENVKEFSFLPQGSILWLTPYYQITTKLFVQYLNVPWEITEKIFWFWPFILLSIVSSFYLTKSWIGVLIYTTNTYILMLVGGGQMGMALSYSIAPFVLATFIKFIDSLVFSTLNFKFQISNFKFQIFVGLILGILMMFDPRIAYISMIAAMVYFILSIKHQVSKRGVLNILVIPIGIAAVLNSYWIIPILQNGFPAEVKNYQSFAGFQFLSFADFSHALALLHPNWPENIFGKIYFLKPEFLLLPILAFSSLFFLKNPKSEIRNPKQIQNQKFKIQNYNLISQYPNILISYFALLGLIGAFLAKGANPPFGEINNFLFQYFPGMSMFRDPTKFYILVALSYSVLIPFSLDQISVYLNSKFKIPRLWRGRQNYQFVIYFLFSIFYFLILLRPAVFGQLGGTFKPQVLPQEYLHLKDFLKDQSQSFKTFWIPSAQRFGFHSTAYPLISAQDYFQTNDLEEILAAIKKTDFKEQLGNLSVKYIIVPYDSQKEIFLTDRKYDEEKYKEAIEMLKTLPDLKLINNFGKIAVFEVKAIK